MKKIFIRASLVLLLMVGMSTSSFALPYFAGDISFSGDASFSNTNLLTPIDSILTLSPATVSSVDGAYSGIATGTTVTFSVPIQFEPSVVVPSSALWTVIVGGITYDLIATSGSVAFDNGGTLVIEGTGTAQMTGYADTPGTWSITANSAGTTGSFSASSTAVPEPMSMLLLGLGLVGLGITRKLKK